MDPENNNTAFINIEDTQYEDTDSLNCILSTCVDNLSNRAPNTNDTNILSPSVSSCSSSNSWKIFFHRTKAFLLTFFAYTAFHMSRKPLSVVKTSQAFVNCSSATNCSSWISEIDGQDPTAANELLGVLDTAFLTCYAVSMFFCGHVAERMNLRLFLCLGMVLSGVCTMMFGVAAVFQIHSFWFFFTIQMLSGVFQSTGWPAVVSIMANWFGKDQRGLIMGLWNIHMSGGNMLGSLVAGFFALQHWGLSFFVPGLVIFVTGIIIYFTLTPSPTDVGLKSDDEGENEDNVVVVDEEAIGFLRAVLIPGVLEFSFCLFFAKMVSYTFLFCLPNYIHSAAGLGPEQSAVMSTVFDVGGFVGGILAGFIADRTQKPALTCCIFLLVSLPLMQTYQTMVSSSCPLTVDVAGSPVYDSCYNLHMSLLSLIGGSVVGPNSLIGTTVASQLGQHQSVAGSGKALATVTAIIDGTASFGAILGPFLASCLVWNNEWSPVFYLLLTANSLATLLLSRLVWREEKP